jgi:hypothetical protein
VAAAFMPLCLHHAPQTAAPATENHEHHCDPAVTEAAASAALVTPGALDDSCGQCSVCHLAGSSALPVCGYHAPALSAAVISAVPPAPTFISYVGKLPHRPPRSV